MVTTRAITTDIPQLRTPAMRWGVPASPTSSLLTRFDNQSASTQERAFAGRTAYREEFQQDHGPDLYERADSNESGREF